MLHKSVARFLSAFVLAAALAFPMTAYAVTLDELTGGEQPASQYEQNTGGDSVGEDDPISAYMRGRKPVSNENMEKAAVIASPLVNALGTLSGGIIMIVSAAIFAITAADLAYIGVPPLRGFLNPAYSAGGGGAAGGMGMGMGMGAGGYGAGRMGMGAMGGGGGAAGGICWVSDEAKFCVSQAGGGQPAVGGMGMGMGMGAGGMGMQGGQQQQGGKSVIFMYLKKRSFFVIVFTICTVVLMSSLFTDCGLNLAALLAKIVGKFSAQTTTVTF